MKNINPDDLQTITAAFQAITAGKKTTEEVLESEAFQSEAARRMLLNMLDMDQSKGILDSNVDKLADQLIGSDSINSQATSDEVLGQVFGKWRAIELLQTGGMGQVFVAQRDDGQFDKKVALKIIKSGLYSTLTEKRFQREMQMLAQLEHPNIARLIDGGQTKDGVTYIVMELVDEAFNLIEYISLNKATATDSLDLMVFVCRALEYAHQHLIIHGDIKPNNVLVNSKSEVKLIDFGVARPVQNTEGDVLPKLTPGYASPEQLAGEKLTTASDVFGACALIKEVFTELTSDEVHAKNDLSALQKQELRFIIEKGLAKEPKARFQSIGELRQELQSVIDNEAVSCHPGGWWYRWQKKWHANKLLITTSVAALAAITMFSIFALVQAKLAKESEQKAQWSKDFLLSMFDQADPIKNKLEPITLNEIIEQAATDLLTSNDQAPDVKVDALELMGQIQFKLGNPGPAEDIRLEQIRLMEQLSYSPQLRAKAHLDTGVLMETKDNLEASTSHFKSAVALMPLDDQVSEVSIKATQSLANSKIRLNQLDESQALLDQIYAKINQLKALENSSEMLAAYYATQAQIDMHQSSYDRALKNIETAWIYGEKLVTDPQLQANIIGIKSSIYYEKGDSFNAAIIDQELVDFYLGLYGENHPLTVNAIARLAVAQAANGEMEKAINNYRQVIAQQELIKSDGQLLPTVYLNLGTALRVVDRHKEALENYTKAEVIWPSLKPRIPIYEATTKAGIARSYLALGELKNAESNFQKAITLVGNEYGIEHPLYARFQMMYAPVLLQENRLQEAQSLIPPAHALIQETYGNQSKRTAVSALRMAQLAHKRGQNEQAKEHLKIVIPVLSDPKIRKRYEQELSDAQNLFSLISNH